MTLDPILAASPEILWHVAFASVAVLTGPVALFRMRRDRLHRWSGRIWVAAIVGLSTTGLLIESHFAGIGHFGPVHLFCILALWGVTEGIWHIRRGAVAAHRACMQSVFFGALGLAGLFTLLPGRTMNRALFGESSDLGFPVVAAGAILLVTFWRRWRRKVSGRAHEFRA